MDLLFLSKSDKADKWRESLFSEIPELRFRIWPNEAEPRDQIDYILVWNPPIGEIKKYPKLKVIFSLGAGVDGMLSDAQLPKNVPIVRLVDRCLTQGMTEYIIYWTLFHHRRMGDYTNIIAERNWNTFHQADTQIKRIGVLGAGELGQNAARALNFLKFDVATWSRSPKVIDEVTSYHGASGFKKILKRSDILICLLPLTPETKGILNACTFATMPKGSILINCARGGHLVDSDLILALDSGQIEAATLDVFHEEPPKNDHPFWNHQKIFMTPHMASLVVPESAATYIAKSIRMVESGQKPPNIVNLKRGY